MADLKTNYKDDVLDTSKNTKRRYNTIQNSDGTISLEDVTEYLQNGDDFGAAGINATNAKVNEVNTNLTASDFLIDASGMSNAGRRGSESAYRSVHFYAPIKSYNASTGILTVNSGGFFYDSAESSCDYKTGVGTITVYLSN